MFGGNQNEVIRTCGGPAVAFGRRAPAPRFRKSAAASGDDPGAGIEPDTPVAVVLGEHHAQSPKRPCGGGGIQAVEYVPGARETAGPVEGRGHVRPEIHGLADVREGDVAEPGSLRILVTVGGSASENGSGPAEATAADPSGPARDRRIAISHSL